MSSSDSLNAQPTSTTTEEDLEAYGILNCTSIDYSTFLLGVSDVKGGRRTMEDAHSFVVDFGSIRGQGFFAVFDGHTGKHSAELCGQYFHEYLLDSLREEPDTSIPDILNTTFHKVDASLTRMFEQSDSRIHSGCTAVTAFLRVEDDEGYQSFTSDVPAILATFETNKGGSGGNLPINGELKDRRESKSRSNCSWIRGAPESIDDGSVGIAN